MTPPLKNDALVIVSRQEDSLEEFERKRNEALAQQAKEERRAQRYGRRASDKDAHTPRDPRLERSLNSITSAMDIKLDLAEARLQSATYKLIAVLVTCGLLVLSSLYQTVSNYFYNNWRRDGRVIQVDIQAKDVAILKKLDEMQAQINKLQSSKP